MWGVQPPQTHRLYLEANHAALEKYRTLCRDIDCDFEEQDAYVYSQERRDKLEREVTVLKQIGFPAEFVLEPALPLQTAGTVRFRNQAQFHPCSSLPSCWSVPDSVMWLAPNGATKST